LRVTIADVQEAQLKAVDDEIAAIQKALPQHAGDRGGAAPTLLVLPADVTVLEPSVSGTADSKLK
jgi:hypothetical protein